jgi:predicted nucleotidyltransferase
MRIVGIICEYNPFHNGHLRQLRLARERAGADCALVCLMSGNYVQRGEPAVFPKQLRVEAALRSGADLVLELPLTVALSSAEGFAAGGVSILSSLGCDRLCFGTESTDFDALLRTARANLDPAFDDLLRSELETGCSYAAARQRALERLGAGAGLSSPNDILAVEYFKALLRQESPMEPLPVLRPNSYHADTLDPAAPSASALRRALWGGKQRQSLRPSAPWLSAVPEALHALYEAAPIHSWEAGERAVLARVRTLPDDAFASLPFGSEGLWSKLMKACRTCASTEEILESVKSKRYSRTRIQRMLLCAFLGLTKADLELPAPYVRVLGFNQRGRALLREVKRRFPLVNAGERPIDEAYFALECRAADLYSLFSTSCPRPAGEEKRQRVTVWEDKQ